MPVWAWKNQPWRLASAAAISTTRPLLPVGLGERARASWICSSTQRQDRRPPSGTACPSCVSAVDACASVRPSVSHGILRVLADLLQLDVARPFCARRPRGSNLGRSTCGPASSTSARIRPVCDVISPPPRRLRRATSSGVPATTTCPPAAAGLGAQVDDPVGRLDDVEVVLDDDDRVAQIDQAVQHVEQLADVVEVQAGRRLVEEVERRPVLGRASSAASLTRWASPPDSVGAGWPSAR